MRLYLSSFRLGRPSERLVTMADGPRVALVPNALDALPAAARNAAIEVDLADLAPTGLTVEVVDLHDPSARRLLSECDIIWVRGGNVFVLRRALADTGADELLTNLISDDAVCYGGYSAGACVLCPDLTPLQAVDDLSGIQSPVTTGLSMLDRLFVPHVNSPGHPETEACTALSQALDAAGQSHWALEDGQVLVVQDRHAEVLG
jgi:dipeptidase E